MVYGGYVPWFRFQQGDFLIPATTPTQFEPQDYLDSIALLDSYGPERMYLTHFGELQWSREKSQLLAQQVLAYRDIALDSSVVDIQAALEAYSLELISQYGAEQSAEELQRMLRFDMPLNSQGLQYWREQSQTN